MKKILIFCFAFFLAASCQKKSADFLTQAEKDFSQAELSNGIPVVFKADDNSETIAVCLLVRGEAKTYEKFSDFRDVAAKLLSSGSASYSNADLQRILYEKEASFSSSANQNGVLISFSCLSRYEDTLFDVFQDGFLHPAFEKSEFEKVLLNIEMARENDLNSPFSLLQTEIRRELYKNHPFENARYYEDDYIDFLRNGGISAVRAIHDEFLNAARLKIVVAGKFEKSKILKKLDAVFGKLERREWNEIEIPQVAPKGNAKITICAASNKSAYLAKVFPTPQVSAPDRIAAIIASQIFDEILFNIVREKNGSCYSVFNSFASSKAGYGATLAYMASDINKIPEGFAEAAEIMKQGKIIGDKKENGEFELLSLEESLEGYKNSYINAIFSALETPSGCAARIANDIFFFDDARHYLNLAEKIRAVEAKDVLAAFNRYFLSQEHQWFIVCGESEREKINLEKF